MNRTIFGIGIIFGVLAIILGAFAAHGLEKMVDAEAVDSFNTGVRYQMYHALFLLLMAGIREIPEDRKKLALYLTVGGVILFSFSIYLLATNSLTTFDFKVIGFLTPIGGILLILAWIVLGYRGFQYLKQH